MRATELFAIFAFIKSLEHIYLTPGYMPSFVDSGVVSVPSLPPILLNIIPYDFFGTPVEVPALPTAVTPVQVDSPVSVATIINAPTCIVYISQIARPRFSPVPPRPQPICLNRHLHPKFEVPGPKSPRIIPSPFPPRSKPNPPFCLPSDKADTESESDNENENDNHDNNSGNDNDNDSIWLELLLSPTFLATVWNFCRMLARRPIRSSISHPEPVDNQSVDSQPWSQPNLVIPRRKKVECRDRVTQPRVFISTLPSLPAGFDTFIITPQRPAEINASATVSAPILSPSSTTEASTLPDRTATAEISPEIVPPVVAQTEVVTSCALSPVPSPSTEPPFDEYVVQPRSSSPTPPTLPIASLPPLVSEESQSGLESSCWAPTPESAPVAGSDTLESASSLPACENTIDVSSASLPTPTPTPAKKRVRTGGPKLLRVPNTELPTVETATADPPKSDLQESSSQSTTTIETPPNSISASIWAPKAAETTPENGVAPTTPTDLSNAEVQDLGVPSTETAMETPLTPAFSLSDSIWTPNQSEVTLEKDNAPIVIPPPSEDKASGLLDSIWAAAPDVPALSQLTCESTSEATGISLPTPTPTPTPERVRTKGPKHLGALQTDLPTVQSATSESSEVQDLGSSTTPLAIETPSEPSSSLSESIWAPKSTENVVLPPVTPPSSEDTTLGLQESICPTEPEAPAPATSVSTSFYLLESSSSQLPSENAGEASTSLPTPPPAQKRVRTTEPEHLRVQSTEQTVTPETTPPPIAEVPLPTTAVETPSESSSSLSGSIWAPKSSEATPENVVAPTVTLSEEKASRLQDSIWATAPDVPEVVAPPLPLSTLPPRATTPDVPKVVTPPTTLPTPPPSAKKSSGLGASIWANDTPAVATSSAPAPICEDDLLACERRNDSVSASRWANAPDTPSIPRPFAGRGGLNRWKGKKGRAYRV